MPRVTDYFLRFTSVLPTLPFLSSPLYFYLLYAAFLLLATWLNWEAETMQGIVPYYRDFAIFFRNGCQLDTPFSQHHYSFPMWGYGLLMAITEEKGILISFQLLTALATAWISERLLASYGLHKNGLLYFRGVILFGFPWMLFHTVLWPYGISACALSLSLLLLFRPSASFTSVFLSAALMGIMLNFRSDFFYFYLLLSGALLLATYFHRLHLRFSQAMVWAFIPILLLLPWRYYTELSVGKALWTSSNSGHHFYISLGQLPGNPWGITPYDNDSSMRALVDERLGSAVSTLDAAADPLLQMAWRDAVLKYPVAFIKKCLFNTALLMSKPFYTGEIEKQLQRILDPWGIESRTFGFTPDSFNLRLFVSLLVERPQYGVLFLPKFIVVMWSLVFFYGTGVLAWRCVRNAALRRSFHPRQGPIAPRSALLLAIGVAAGYQWAILIGVYMMSAYHTNVYLLYAAAGAIMISQLHTASEDQR